MENDAARELEWASNALSRARRVVVLTGAGVSAESGIATFRDAQTGHWSRYNPEVLASANGFARDPGLVWRWYMERFGRASEAMPNPAHHALVELEQRLPAVTLVTQNVDDLHERAGSRRVLHLHGTLSAFRCSRCRQPYTLEPDDRRRELPPVCAACGAYIRPGVVWFGEQLPQLPQQEAWNAVRACDLCLVVGTSGVVMPAAALPEAAKSFGAQVIEVNVERSEITQYADCFLQGAAGNILPRLVASLLAPPK